LARATQVILLVVELVRPVHPVLSLNYPDSNSENTAEQRAAIISASSNNPAHSVLQSEKVIGSGRLMHGGKSVAKLQALWEMGLPKDYRE